MKRWKRVKKERKEVKEATENVGMWRQEGGMDRIW